MTAQPQLAEPALHLEPLDAETVLHHAATLHAWVTHPRSVFWGMQGASREEVAEEYLRIAAEPDHDAHLGYADGVPAFLAELYDPARSPLAGLVGMPDLEPGDVGMHVLVAPPERPRAGFTRAVFGAVMRLCFADPNVRRVVVEPDVRNERIGRLNAEAGFVVARHLPLSGKTAALSFCTRTAFEQSPLGGSR
jgi:RimJ/RimL family protein N-acetyltransferase